MAKHLVLARWPAAGLLLAATAALGGCASGPPESAVDSAMAVASAEIGQARQDGALANAALPMQEAEQKLAAAQQAKAGGDNAGALRLANEAKADADLADTTSRAVQAQQAAATVRGDIGALKQATSPTQ